MEDILYNVLWIDDEHEALTGTKARAKRNGINLVPFKSLNGGMDELERNYPYYDGVLLDAKFFEDEDDKKGSEDTYNVHRANERLLKLKKTFEVFIFTGQAEAYEDNTFKKAFPNIYKKGSDSEMERLFSDIRIAAAKQEDTQIRHNYKRVFDVCTEKYIGEIAGQDILNLFKSISEPSINKQFADIRKIVEDLFIAFHKFNLLPLEFITPSVAITESSKFLAGCDGKGEFFKEKGYKHLKETHLPIQIAKNLKSIILTTNPGSHRSEVDLFVSTLKTPFLFNSVFFQLLDVIVWFKIYVDSNPKTGNWIKVRTPNGTHEPTLELIPGKIVNINQLKGYAFFKPSLIGDNVFIPPHLVAKFSLKEEMLVQVEVEEYTDNRTNEFKKRVKRIEL